MRCLTLWTVLTNRFSYQTDNQVCYCLFNTIILFVVLFSLYYSHFQCSFCQKVLINCHLKMTQRLYHYVISQLILILSQYAANQRRNGKQGHFEDHNSDHTFIKNNDLVQVILCVQYIHEYHICVLNSRKKRSEWLICMHIWLHYIKCYMHICIKPGTFVCYSIVVSILTIIQCDISVD